MRRQSNIQGRGNGYRAARDIDARLRDWCTTHPFRAPGTLTHHDTAETLGIPEATLVQALADTVAS